MLPMLAVTEIASAPLNSPCALRDRPEESGLCRWFKLQVVAHAGRKQRGAAKRIGCRECRVAPDRLIDGRERG